MNEHGFYDGWTEHTVTVKAHLAFGIDVNVSGTSRRIAALDIKEYIAEIFDAELRRMVPEYDERETAE